MKGKDRKLHKRHLGGKKKSFFLIISFYLVTRINSADVSKAILDSVCSLCCEISDQSSLYKSKWKSQRFLFYLTRISAWFQSWKSHSLELWKLCVCIIVKLAIRKKQCKTLMFIKCTKKTHCWSYTPGSHTFLHTYDKTAYAWSACKLNLEGS